MDVPAQAFRLFCRRPAAFACLCAVVVRLAWCTVGLAGSFFQVHTERFWHMGPTGRGYFFTPLQALDMGCRWDSIFYLHIAQQGYTCPPDDLCAAFFPLFPLIVAAVHAVTTLPYYLCGLGVANVADIISWILMAYWCRRHLPERAAWWSFCSFVAFPTRNFGFSVYTEGLFLSLSLGAFLAYESRRFAPCSLCCLLLSAVRPQGIFVGAALGADAVWRRWRPWPWPRPSLSGQKQEQQQQQEQNLPAWALASLGAAPAGLLAYMAYLMHRFGRPLLFMEVQRVWNRHWVAPWRIFGVHADPLEYVVLLVAGAILVVMVQRRAPLRDCVYVALSLLVPMSTGRLTSINRFVGVLFPLFIYAVVYRPAPRWCWLYWVTAVIYGCVFAFKLGQGATVI